MHSELVDRGFIRKLSEMPQNLQDLVHGAPFRHYYPWTAVFKEDSKSTPVRIVVNPTMTGLNEILAKGENMVGEIPPILLRNRLNSHAWSSDISKLYNQLKLVQRNPLLPHIIPSRFRPRNEA